MSVPTPHRDKLTRIIYSEISGLYPILTVIRIDPVCEYRSFRQGLRYYYDYRSYNTVIHDDVIKWKHFPRHWIFVHGEFPTQRPVTRSFDVFFDQRLNKRLSKQWWGWWLEKLSRPLWRHRNVMTIVQLKSNRTTSNKNVEQLGVLW